MRAIVFTALDESFALPLEAVREVTQPQPLAKIPFSPEVFVGAMNLRGRMLAVLAPEMFLGRTAQPWLAPADGTPRFLIHDSAESALALRVNGVEKNHELTLRADEDSGGASSDDGGAARRASLSRGRARLSSWGRGAPDRCRRARS
ncbi:MAG: chemotaxis protein CheW [Myxococcales bacterium]|nr:chemotaxis protein CheW [Myxococcales bacterium]